MKVKSLLTATMAGLSLGAYAAPEADKATETKAPATDAQKAAAKKQAKPHSHVEAKTGVAQKTPDTMSDKPNAADDKSKHFHPRDGK